MDLSKVTPIMKARAVFDAIDLDASGKVENFELKELLTWWGCPESELDSYMKGFDADGDGEISFDDEFYPEMQVRCARLRPPGGSPPRADRIIWRSPHSGNLALRMGPRACLPGRAHSADYPASPVDARALFVHLRRCSSPRS
jgi:hypothetical protein